MLGCLFQENGDHSVVLTTNGREAWGLLEKGERFDYIISDYQMPEMNGIGLLLNIRNDPRLDLAEIPFILMSGGSIQSSQEELEEMCTKYGATFLAKPFSINDLVALLEDAGCS